MATRDFTPGTLDVMAENLDTNAGSFWDGVGDFFTKIGNCFNHYQNLNEDMSNLTDYLKNYLELEDMGAKEFSALMDEVCRVEKAHEKKVLTLKDRMMGISASLKQHEITLDEKAEQELKKKYPVVMPKEFKELQKLYEKLFPEDARYAFGQNGWSAGFEDTDLEWLNELLIKYNITDPKSICFLFAQVAGETHFGVAKVENRSENDANEKYKTTNGNKEPGDGYKYRGGGYIQLTGRKNYQAFSDFLAKEGRYDPKIMEEGAVYVAENYAWEASLYYWTEISHLNHLIVDENYSFEDVSDIVGFGHKEPNKNPPNYDTWKKPIYEELKGVFYEE